MKKMTVAEIVAMKPSLDKLANTLLPAKVSYAVSKVLTAIAPALHDASQDNIALYRALGKPSEDGTMFEIPVENRDEFNAGLETIMHREVSVHLHHICIESFNDTLIEPSVLIAISPLLVGAPVNDDGVSGG
jgi:hypothetical protein